MQLLLLKWRHNKQIGHLGKAEGREPRLREGKREAASLTD